LGKLSWVARSYICTVVLVAVVLVARGPLGGISWPDVAVLGAIVAIFESMATVLRSR